ncbi:MAG: hypothetical protein ACTS6H_00985 [Candidatus Hodgkinia cicadicola]
MRSLFSSLACSSVSIIKGVQISHIIIEGYFEVYLEIWIIRFFNIKVKCHLG